MKNDFQPVTGHAFQLRGDSGSVDCKVLTLEPNKTLAYTWGAFGLVSVVTWTLTATATGTLVRMEHAGFGPGPQGAGVQGSDLRLEGISWAHWNEWWRDWSSEWMMFCHLRRTPPGGKAPVGGEFPSATGLLKS